MTKFIGSYTIRVTCGNCGDENRIEIPKGQAIQATPCPTCGCRALEKALMASGYPSTRGEASDR